MTARDVIKLLTSFGWLEDRQVGSHKHFKKEDNPNIVTVPTHGKSDIPLGTLKNIERKSGVKLTK
ncbi:MAG TPA: type II toxin-antitoxin system HicA family toxin [Campylobacterales bacterium]|nr:type II toxin-antitoxin system HicA family toxin [Campylobacterales bacterium]